MKIRKPIVIILLPMIFAGIGVYLGKYSTLADVDYQALIQRINRLENGAVNNAYEKNIESLKNRLEKLEALASANHQPPNAAKSGVSDYLITLEERQSALEEYVYSLSEIPGKRVASASLNQDTGDLPATNKLTSGAEAKIDEGMRLLDSAVNEGQLNKESHEKLDKILVAADNESKKMLWERMFADIRAGKYQLPDEEPATDYYELPNDGVVGE
jgi:hypothetical protein